MKILKKLPEELKVIPVLSIALFVFIWVIFNIWTSIWVTLLSAISTVIIYSLIDYYCSVD